MKRSTSRRNAAPSTSHLSQERDGGANQEERISEIKDGTREWQLDRLLMNPRSHAWQTAEGPRRPDPWVTDGARRQHGESPMIMDFRRTALILVSAGLSISCIHPHNPAVEAISNSPTGLQRWYCLSPSTEHGHPPESDIDKPLTSTIVSLATTSIPDPISVRIAGVRIDIPREECIRWVAAHPAAVNPIQATRLVAAFDKGGTVDLTQFKDFRAPEWIEWMTLDLMHTRSVTFTSLDTGHPIEELCVSTYALGYSGGRVVALVGGPMVFMVAYWVI